MHRFRPLEVVRSAAKCTSCGAQALRARGYQPGDVAGGSRGEVALGSALATQYGKRPGDTLALPVAPKDAGPDFVSHRFTVVGVLARTGSIDTFAYVNDADARMLLQDTLPASLHGSVDTATIAQGFTVYARRGASLAEMDALTALINRQVPGVHANKPSAMVANFKATGTTFTAIALGGRPPGPGHRRPRSSTR